MRYQIPFGLKMLRSAICASSLLMSVQGCAVEVPAAPAQVESDRSTVVEDDPFGSIQEGLIATVTTGDSQIAFIQVGDAASMHEVYETHSYLEHFKELAASPLEMYMALTGVDEQSAPEALISDHWLRALEAPRVLDAVTSFDALRHGSTSAHTSCSMTAVPGSCDNQIPGTGESNWLAGFESGPCNPGSYPNPTSPACWNGVLTGVDTTQAESFFSCNVSGTHSILFVVGNIFAPTHSHQIFVGSGRKYLYFMSHCQSVNAQTNIGFVNETGTIRMCGRKKQTVC